MSFYRKPTVEEYERARRKSAQLPEFSGDSVACGKCGRVGAMTDYRASHSIAGLPLLGEHLRRTCPRCGYQWNERVVRSPDAHDGADPAVGAA